MTMANTLLISSLLIVLFIILFVLFFYSKRKNRLVKRKKISISCKPFSKDQEFNPDITTENWDLHKIRLKKFGRSQYKGLTFFMNSEKRIYYLSAKGNKVYC